MCGVFAGPSGCLLAVLGPAGSAVCPKRALRLMRSEGQDQAVRQVMERLAEPNVIEILEDSLTRVGIEQWLRASNRVLGGRRPLELVREGDLDNVGRGGPGLR